MTRSTHGTLHRYFQIKSQGHHLKTERICPVCGKRTCRVGVLCKDCALKQQTKIILPNSAILQEWIDKFSLEEVARRVNVSSNALRRWIKKLNLHYTPKKPKGNPALFTDPKIREKAKTARIEYAKTHPKKIPLTGQYTKEGSLISTYEYTRDIRNAGFNMSGVNKVICGVLKSYKGFVWKRIS